MCCLNSRAHFLFCTAAALVLLVLQRQFTAAAAAAAAAVLLLSALSVHTQKTTPHQPEYFCVNYILLIQSPADIELPLDTCISFTIASARQTAHGRIYNFRFYLHTNVTDPSTSTQNTQHSRVHNSINYRLLFTSDRCKD